MNFSSEAFYNIWRIAVRVVLPVSIVVAIVALIGQYRIECQMAQVWVAYATPEQQWHIVCRISAGNDRCGCNSAKWNCDTQVRIA